MSDYKRSDAGVAAIQTCQSCKAEIRFVEMARSRRSAPLDAEPDQAKGTVEILPDGTGQVLKGEELWAARQQGRELYVSHFATCPDAKGWRRRR